MADDGTRYTWFRLGDNTREVDRAIAQCARENGGRLVGAPTRAHRHAGDGRSVTVLQAAGRWWLDYMKVRGKEWVGPATQEQIADILDQLDSR
jgi:hypothetical protein